jgi:type II secretory pathway pseudopilin PulG
MSKQQAGFSAIEGMVVLVIVAVIGGAAFFVLSRNKDDATKTVATSTDVSKDNTSTKASKAPETITVANAGDYKKVDASKELKIYDATVEGSTLTESTSSYMTLQIPASAVVYKLEPTKENPFRKYMIKTTNGKYVHIFDVGGVGGDCPPNTTSYTLVKKLPTATSNLFFTQYEIDGKQGDLLLEDFSRSPFPSDTSSRHFALKEGESNTDACNLSFYQKIFDYVHFSISDVEKASLASTFSWDDVKDDKDFVAMLQSLKVVK